MPSDMHHLQLIVLKSIFSVLLALLAYAMYMARNTGLELSSDRGIGHRYNPHDLNLKRMYAWGAFWLTWPVIGLAEATKLASDVHERTTLFYVHLFFALSFLILMFVMLMFNKSGLKDPKNHRWYALGALSTFTGMLGTGIMLMIRLT